MRIRSLPLVTLLAISTVATPFVGSAAEDVHPKLVKVTQEATMKINIEIDGKKFSVTLADSPASKEFASMLPLTLPFKDFSDNEKIAYLPNRLSSTKGAESDARIGDLAYYAPWGNIIVYHGSYSSSPDVIKLGEFDGNVDFFRTRGEVTATITRAD